MSNPTSNFNWQMPTATDLVTDLPADFEVFGQAVDSSMADLLGGTTGQILAKNSNTNMDFVWTTPNPGDITGVTAGTGISGGGTSGDVTITNSMATEITAAGDMIIGTGSGTFDNLPIGTTGQLLTADTTVSPYKVKWATPAVATSGLTKIVTGTFTTSAGVAINGCFTATYDNYVVLISKFKSQGNLEYMYVQFQTGTSTVQATNYYSGGYFMFSNGTTGNLNVANGAKINLGQYTDVARGFATLNVSLNGYPSFHGSGNGGNSDGISIFGGEVDASNTYTGLKITGTGNISGAYTVYGLEK